jgi:hypothetical protein
VRGVRETVEGTVLTVVPLIAGVAAVLTWYGATISNKLRWLAPRYKVSKTEDADITKFNDKAKKGYNMIKSTSLEFARHAGFAIVSKCIGLDSLSL